MHHEYLQNCYINRRYFWQKFADYLIPRASTGMKQIHVPVLPSFLSRNYILLITKISEPPQTWHGLLIVSSHLVRRTSTCCCSPFFPGKAIASTWAYQARSNWSQTECSFQTAWIPAPQPSWTIVSFLSVLDRELSQIEQDLPLNSQQREQTAVNTCVRELVSKRIQIVIPVCTRLRAVRNLMGFSPML